MDNPMTDITLEQRARELLAAELDEYGLQSTARIVRDGTKMNPTERAAVAAIKAALRLSAGADWVLVPREPTEDMRRVLYQTLTDCHSVDESYADLLAAAPRHEPGEVDDDSDREPCSFCLDRSCNGECGGDL